MMFKTIFSKMIAIFLVILAIAFSITGVVLNLFLDDYFTKEKAVTLEEGSKWVDQLFNSYIEELQISRVKADLYLTTWLDQMESLTGSIIWIVDDNGNMIRSSEEFSDDLKKKV